MQLSAPVAERVAALLGQSVTGALPLHGGDLSEVVRVRLASGGSVVAKLGPLVEIEAEMLAAVAQTGAPAPQVRAAISGLIVMEDLAEDTGLAGAWADLGRVLRRLHGDVGRHYGWPVDYAFGPVAIENAEMDRWPAFWAERRLRVHLPFVPSDLARRVAALADRLEAHLPPDPPAALLHGDLWVGNVMARNGRVTGLIDPACYRGDPEVDLAMLALFGQPGAEFGHTYGALAPGWQARRQIYQLWPALVHFRLFGDGYRGLVDRCLDGFA